MKCDICGRESDFEAAFIQERSPFQGAKQTVCSSCSIKRNNRVEIFTLVGLLAAGVLGILLKWLNLDQRIADPLLYASLGMLFLVAMILPHEAGHALVARAFGWSVLRVTVGIGKSVWKWRWSGTQIDVRMFPVVGATWVLPKDMRHFRLKSFLNILAGPMVNAVLAVGVILLWRPELTLSGINALPMVPCVLSYVNVAIVVINLWPFQPHVGFGLPTDGMQLLQLLSFRKESLNKLRALQFQMETVICREQFDLAGARVACDKGLALCPEDTNLLNLAGVNALDEHEFERAREIFLKLLARKDQSPFIHFILLNNLAYADVLLDDPALLPEADAYSREAYEGAPWHTAISSTRGTVLIALGKCEEGVALLKESLEDETSPRSRAENSCHMAIGLVAIGQVEEARKYLALAEELHPECRLLDRVRRVMV